MEPEAVFFDLGDTLIFQAHLPDRARLYSAMAERLRPLLIGWGVAPGIDLLALLAELFPAVEQSQIARRERGLEVDGAFVARGALAAYGIDASAERADAFWRATAVDYKLWGAQLYPDTLDTLRRLRELSLPVACVSNSLYPSEAMRSQLDSLGVSDDLLPVLVSSSDMMRPKPRPEPFRRALDAVGLDTAGVVFAGDSLEADVRGAKALGMTTVWKLNGRHEVPPDPTPITWSTTCGSCSRSDCCQTPRRASRRRKA